MTSENTVQIDKGVSGTVLQILAKHSDLVLPIALLLIIGTLFIQVPSILLSVLILVNLGISILVLVTSLFIKTPLQLTAYPTILLLTTILRLALSVSVTRNILTTGEAGGVVESLGKITAAGDPLIGAVLFVIILVVQFIVVGKGSERVAEVAARFTLDAMPGKQMAIDADLRAGLITQEAAKSQRNDLQRESQLHGAMDGAMKFVKNDSVATIIIAIVNISAGLTIGVLRKGMTLPEATQKYTVLTFGDGLAAIIASLLITISAGIVVTRVASDDSKDSATVGTDIGLQVFSNYKALYITGGVLSLLSFVNIYFAFVGIGFGLIGFWLSSKKKSASLNSIETLQNQNSLQQSADEPNLSFTVPLAIVASKELTPLVSNDTETGLMLREDIPRLRSSLYYDLGVLLPYCHVTGDAPLPEYEYFIAVKEVPVARGKIRVDCLFVNDSAENIKIFGIDGEDVSNPADLKPGSWIPQSQRHIAENAGLKVWEPQEVIVLHLSHVMRRFAHTFIGIQEAQGYLDFLGYAMPNLVEEVVGKVITVHQFTDVLQRLVQEGISIKDTKSILDALSEYGRMEKDSVLLTEHVRSAFKRYISFKYTGARDSIFVYLLDPEIEDVIRSSIRRTSTGSFLTLDPMIANDIMEAIRKEIVYLPANAQQPVIVTDIEIRRYVKKLIDVEFPQVTVLSYQELPPELNIQPVGRISLQALVDDFDLSDDEQEQFPVSNGYLLHNPDEIAA